MKENLSKEFIDSMPHGDIALMIFFLYISYAAAETSFQYEGIEKNSQDEIAEDDTYNQLTLTNDDNTPATEEFYNSFDRN